MKVKGDQIPDRPHRAARLVTVPKVIAVLPSVELTSASVRGLAQVSQLTSGSAWAAVLPSAKLVSALELLSIPNRRPEPLL